MLDVKLKTNREHLCNTKCGLIITFLKNRSLEGIVAIENNSFQIITELWVKRRPISVQICIMCVACNGTKRSSLFLEQKKVTGVTKSTKSANNSVSRMFSLFFLLEFV